MRTSPTYSRYIQPRSHGDLQHSTQNSAYPPRNGSACMSIISTIICSRSLCHAVTCTVTFGPRRPILAINSFALAGTLVFCLDLARFTQPITFHIYLTFLSLLHCVPAPCFHFSIHYSSPIPTSFVYATGTVSILSRLRSGFILIHFVCLFP